MSFVNISKFIGGFLDYNYYRVAKFYFKKEGSYASTALIHVCLIVSMAFAPVIILFLIFIYTKFEIPRGVGKIYIRIISILYCLFIYLIVSRRYKENGIYLRLRDRWSEEDRKTKVLRGVGVILSVLVPTLICILILVNRDNIRDWFDTF